MATRVTVVTAVCGDDVSFEILSRNCCDQSTATTTAAAVLCISAYDTTRQKNAQRDTAIADAVVHEMHESHAVS